MIQKIIVTDDGTAVSDMAIEMASEIAKGLRAHLILLHIIDPTEHPESALFENDKELIEKAKQMNLIESKKDTWEERVKRKIQELSEKKIDSTSECRTGSPVEKILSFVDDNKADMIVMGSGKRLTGVSKIKALDSVTRKVSEMANCPVLIVH